MAGQEPPRRVNNPCVAYPAQDGQVRYECYPCVALRKANGSNSARLMLCGNRRMRMETMFEEEAGFDGRTEPSSCSGDWGIPMKELERELIGGHNKQQAETMKSTIEVRVC